MLWLECLFVLVLSAWITARITRGPGELPINLVIGLFGASAAVVGAAMFGLAPRFGMILLTGPLANLVSAFAGAITALAVRHAVARP